MSILPEPDPEPRALPDAALEPPRGADEFAAFIADVSEALSSVVERAPEAPADRWFLDRSRLAWEWVSTEERIAGEGG